MRASTLLALGAVTGLVTVAHADFFEDFDTDTSASWITLYSDANAANHEATFSWDYFNDNGAALGFKIPSAPHSVGGTTKGLRMRTNISAGLISGLSASPIGQAFTGNFVLTADVWLNFYGPGPAGASGTTQLASMGWGTAGTVAQTHQNNTVTRDSVFMSTTLDGGSSVDWRIHANDNRFTVANGLYYGAFNGSNYVAGVYPTADEVGNLNASNTYWSTAFPTITIPAALADNYPSQNGTTNPGSTGFQWREWKMVKNENTLTFFIDGTLIGTVDLSFCTVSSTPNLLVGMMDTNNGSAADPDGLNSMIVDNIRVVSGAENQHLTGTLALNDTVSEFVFARNISYEVKQGTLTVASGSVVATTPNSSFDISMPPAVTGAATISWDGSSFLKRNTLVSLTGSSQSVGTVNVQNGDVDGTGEVDAADIDSVIAAFGQMNDQNEDVDVSGEVDAADTDIVIANFGGMDD